MRGYTIAGMLQVCALFGAEALPTREQGLDTKQASPYSENTFGSNLATLNGLGYGHAIGVNHDEMNGHPKYFDDTGLIYYDIHYHRSLRRVNCYHKGGQLIALEEYYTLADGSEGAWSGYHGYSPTPSSDAKKNYYELKYHEFWSGIHYKICGKKITGIYFETNFSGSGVSCGDWKIYKHDPCFGDVLRPAKGRKIVGIFGDANGKYFTLRKGIRGIGLITL